MGLSADLTAGEIVEQLVHASSVSRIQNIVFMVGWGGWEGWWVVRSGGLSGSGQGLVDNPTCPLDWPWLDWPPPCPAVFSLPLLCPSRPVHTHGPPPPRPAQGMGEPLNNYEAVRTAVRLMTDPSSFALRRRKVTVSTVGVIPRMLQMADDMPGVR